MHFEPVLSTDNTNTVLTILDGRDKVVAVINARKQCNLRVGFERWRMKSMLKRRADGVRRGQLKLRVREDEISVVSKWSPGSKWIS